MSRYYTSYHVFNSGTHLHGFHAGRSIGPPFWVGCTSPAVVYSKLSSGNVSITRLESLKRTRRPRELQIIPHDYRANGCRYCTASSVSPLTSGPDSRTTQDTIAVGARHNALAFPVCLKSTCLLRTRRTPRSSQSPTFTPSRTFQHCCEQHGCCTTRRPRAVYAPAYQT